MFFALRGSARPTSVRLGDRELADAASRGVLDAAATDTYIWDAATTTTLVKLFDREPQVVLRVTGR